MTSWEHRFVGRLSTVALAGWSVIQAPGDPSPTLGSTTSPGPSLPGPQDPDPHDYTGTIWVVVAIAVVALVIAGGTFWLVRSRRIDLNPQGPPDSNDPAD